jgi:hypothetical protein
MGYYEPRWSAEEQTMIDLMNIAGCEVVSDINKEYTTIHVHLPYIKSSLSFKDCTEYGAIRKAFNAWSAHNA